MKEIVCERNTQTKDHDNNYAKTHKTRMNGVCSSCVFYMDYAFPSGADSDPNA